MTEGCARDVLRPLGAIDVGPALRRRVLAAIATEEVPRAPSRKAWGTKSWWVATTAIAITAMIGIVASYAMPRLGGPADTGAGAPQPGPVEISNAAMGFDLLVPAGWTVVSTPRDGPYTSIVAASEGPASSRSTVSVFVCEAGWGCGLPKGEPGQPMVFDGASARRATYTLSGNGSSQAEGETEIVVRRGTFIYDLWIVTPSGSSEKVAEAWLTANWHWTGKAS